MAEAVTLLVFVLMLLGCVLTDISVIYALIGGLACFSSLYHYTMKYSGFPAWKMLWKGVKDSRIHTCCICTYRFSDRCLEGVRHHTMYCVLFSVIHGAQILSGAYIPALLRDVCADRHFLRDRVHHGGNLRKYRQGP